MNERLREEVVAELEALRAANTYKTFLELRSPQGPVVEMAGRGGVFGDIEEQRKFWQQVAKDTLDGERQRISISIPKRDLLRQLRFFVRESKSHPQVCCGY